MYYINSGIGLVISKLLGTGLFHRPVGLVWYTPQRQHMVAAWSLNVKSASSSGRISRSLKATCMNVHSHMCGRTYIREMARTASLDIRVQHCREPTVNRLSVQRSTNWSARRNPGVHDREKGRALRATSTEKWHWRRLRDRRRRRRRAIGWLGRH